MDEAIRVGGYSDPDSSRDAHAGPAAVCLACGVASHRGKERENAAPTFKHEEY